MDFLKATCDMNDRAVSMLMAGRSQAALTSFQEILTAIKGFVNREDPSAITREAIDGSSLSQACLTVFYSPFNLPLSYSDCFVYSRPLIIKASYYSQDLGVLLSLHSAAVLFNMALTCHQIGRQGKEKSLKRAAVLYKMSVQLLLCLPLSDSTVSLALALLALNNRAQILYELCEYQLSQSCLKEMARLIQVTRELPKSLQERDLEGILLNVMLLKTPSAAQAA